MRNGVASSLLVITLVAFPLSQCAWAAVMCVKKADTGEPRDGAPIRFRRVCKAAEAQLDPVALGLRGPRGPRGKRGEIGPQGPAAPVPLEVNLRVTASPRTLAETDQIPFDVEVWDTADMHTSDAPTEISIPETGKYLILATAQATQGCVGGASFRLRLDVSSGAFSFLSEPESLLPQMSITEVVGMEEGDVLTASFTGPCMTTDVQSVDLAITKLD